MSVEGIPQRILIAGVSGVGKTTFAREISRVTGISHTEIDGLYHGPGWTPRTEFVRDVERLAAAPAWVTEWQYREARPILLARAELLIWLDLPRAVSLWRVIRRTWRRRRTREKLWNGNIEPGLVHAIFADEGIIRWALRTHGRFPTLVAEAQASEPGVPVVRLRSSRAMREWLSALSG